MSTKNKGPACAEPLLPQPPGPPFRGSPQPGRPATLTQLDFDVTQPVSRYATYSALALFTILFLLALLPGLALVVLLLLARLLPTALLLLLTRLAILLVRILILLVHLQSTPSVCVRVNAPRTGWLLRNCARFLHAERLRCSVDTQDAEHLCAATRCPVDSTPLSHPSRLPLQVPTVNSFADGAGACGPVQIHLDNLTLFSLLGGAWNTSLNSSSTVSRSAPSTA